MTELLRYFAANAGVEDVGAFDAVERDLGLPLPADYKGFLMKTDGGETIPPLKRFYFYPLAELLSRRVDGQPPDVLEFGTDDGDGYGFDSLRGRRSANYPVVKYPLGEQVRDELDDVADDFASFVGGLGRTPK